jgi:hypothetical protein
LIEFVTSELVPLAVSGKVVDDVSSGAIQTRILDLPAVHPCKRGGKSRMYAIIIKRINVFE